MGMLGIKMSTLYGQSPILLGRKANYLKQLNPVFTRLALEGREESYIY